MAFHVYLIFDELLYLKKMPLGDDVDATKLAKETKGYVGSDIEGVCREAAIIALRENMDSEKVFMKHFKEALHAVKASITKEVEEAYKKLESYFSTARAQEIKEVKASYFG